MSINLKNDEPKEDKNEEKVTVHKDELETLLKAIEELEKTKLKKGKKPRNFIAIEFGGVFHHNIIINFVFTFILNLTLIYLLIEVFNFAKYSDIIYVIILALIYTFFETIYKSYILFNHFSFVIKSLGFIFYIGYVAIFYALDVYLFQDAFSFGDETLLIAFVALFAVIRYIIGTTLIRYFRNKNLR